MVCAAFAALSVMTASGASLSYEDLSDLRGPYAGTDWLGRAFHAVRLGEAGRIPVYAYWCSSAKVVSPWFGRGWSIPFVESRIFPIGERSLELHQPDGYVRYFHKGATGKYVGGRHWTAERNQDEIRVTADSRDGFPKSVFVFLRGRLVKMECEEGAYEFRHDSRNGDAVICKGKTVFSLKRDTSDPDILRLEVGGRRITATRRVASLVLPPSALGSVPGRSDEPCLAELSFADGARRTFAYGEDGAFARFATEGDNLLWEPATGKIAASAGYRFKVGTRPNDMSGPKITRIDADGHAESYFNDVAQGLTSEVAADGTGVTTRRFTSGDNAGRVRWREYTAGGAVNKRIDYIYDSTGHVRSELVRDERK